MEKKRTIREFLGEDTVKNSPEIYVGYKIRESYEQQLRYLTKTITDSRLLNSIYSDYESIAGCGTRVSDPKIPLALEELCKEVEMFLGWRAGKVNFDDLSEHCVGDTTICYVGDDVYMWG